MDDLKRAEAYRLAQSMDQQQAEAAEIDRQERVDNFLKVIGQIESSGGQNFNHDLIESGMHKGHRAAGTYGLMPNTVQEVLNRMKQQGDLDPRLQKLEGMEPDSVKAAVESDPEVEQMLARNLARKVLEKQNDEEKAAYSWFQGHNLSPEEIDKRDYKEHDYVKKYNRFKNLKNMLGGK